MVNLKEKAHNAVVVVKGNCGKVSKKALAALCSASLAMSAMAVNAFAAESTGTSDVSSMYDTIANAFKDGITAASNGIVLIFGAIIPIGIGIIGLYSALGAGKRIFKKLVG